MSPITSKENQPTRAPRGPQQKRINGGVEREGYYLTTNGENLRSGSQDKEREQCIREG